MPGTITLSRGERLALLATAKTNGVAITLDSSWLIGAAIMENGTSAPIDLSPTIVLGKVAIDFDTADLRPGTYVMDLRFTRQGSDQFTQKLKVIIERTVTTPSPR